MSDKRYQLTRRKALAGLATVGVAGAGAGLGTSALFNDEESFTNNTIQAGTLNMSVEVSLVDASSEFGKTQFLVNNEPRTLSVGDSFEMDGDQPYTSAALTDIKPGDWFVVCFNVDVAGNPAYVGFQASNLADSEGPNPEPEPSPGSDDDDDAIPGGGDLDNVAEVTMGYDSDPNDNSYNGPITSESSISSISMTSFLDQLDSGYLYRGRNGDGGSPPGGHGESGALPTRIGENGDADVDQVTHYVEFSIPDTVGNEIMGDSVSFDLTWYAEQVRNNSPPSSVSDLSDGNPN